MLCSIKLVLLCVFIYGFLELREHEVMCIPQASRAKMQKNVLDIFGMENRPRPNLFESLHRDVSVSAKKYMIGLYETVQENDIFQETKRKTNQSSATTMNNKTDVLYDADTIVSFVNNGLVPRPNASDEDGAMFFDIQSNLVIEDTLASEVRVYLNVTKKKIPDNVFKVTVYKIIIPRVKYMVLTSRIVNATESQWHEFDVLKASTAWKDDSSQNNGILVVCETLNNRARPFKECGLIDFRSEDENKPFLVSFYQSGNEDEILAEQLPEDDEAVSKAYEKERARRSLYVKERARRSLGQLFPKAGDSLPRIFHSKGDNSTCRRHPLYIAFKDLGWSDWIIAPEGYKAAYCGGECKFPLHENMNASNHAIIQTLVHLMLPDKIPEPCCAPTCLEPLKVLYLDESNNVIMKTYANMVVKDCGCQ